MFEAAELALYRLGAQPAHNNRAQRTAQVLISTPKEQDCSEYAELQLRKDSVDKLSSAGWHHSLTQISGDADSDERLCVCCLGTIYRLRISLVQAASVNAYHAH